MLNTRSFPRDRRILQRQQRRSRWARKWNIFWDRNLQRSLSFLEWFSIRPNVIGSYESIRLARTRVSKDAEPFLSTVRDVLSLIRDYDPRAWKMIERDVRYIWDAYLIGAAGYRRRERCCAVNFDQCFPEDDPEHSAEDNHIWRVAQLAGAIVHEATHGKLASLGFSYNKVTRARIERTCVKRENFFLTRLPSDDFDFTALASAFDADQWEPYWNPAQYRRMQREEWNKFWQERRQKRAK